MRRILVAVATAFLGLVSLPAEATTCSTSNPYSFDSASIVNGSTASATPVMGDLNYLLYCANTNVAPVLNPSLVGAVGINTSTPAAVLDVQGGTNSAGQIRLGTATQAGNITFRRGNDGAIGAWIGWAGATENGVFDIADVSGGGALSLKVSNSGSMRVQSYNGSSYDTRFTVLGNGNVGIGTTSPAYLLDVNGTINASGINITNGNASYSSTGNLYVDASAAGTVNLRTAGYGPGVKVQALTVTMLGLANCNPIKVDSSGVLNCSSDERLKAIYGPYTAGLAAAEMIVPIRYNWRTDSGYHNDEPLLGFSAQNVGRAVPEAVTTTSTGRLQLNSEAILATAINSIKDLKALSDKEAAEIARLRDTNASLAASVRALEARMAAFERKSRTHMARN